MIVRVRFLRARGDFPAGTLATLDSLCTCPGSYPFTYVTLDDGSFLCISPLDLEVVSMEVLN